jgi:hypothetical protein
VIYDPLFPIPKIISTFVAPSEIYFNSTFSDRITYAKRSGTNEFAIKNSKVITKYHLEGNTPIMDLQIPVNSPGKADIAYVGDNIFYPVPFAIKVYDCTSSNTSFIPLSGTPDRLLTDKTPGGELLIGAYTGGSDTLFIIDPYGKSVLYEGQAPDYINFRPEAMCLNSINNQLFFLPNIPSNEIVIIDYVDPSNPAHKNTISNERDVLQLGTSQDNVVYTDYDGQDYRLHFLRLDKNGNVVNDDVYPYTGTYDGFNTLFFTFNDKLAIPLGNMNYVIAEYTGGPSSDSYDYYPYPNPTDGIVNIANLGTGTKIRLLSSDGWEIDHYQMDSDGIFTIDFRNINDTYLSSGRYMIILDMPDENKPIVKAVYFNRERR